MYQSKFQLRQKFECKKNGTMKLLEDLVFFQYFIIKISDIGKVKRIVQLNTLKHTACILQLTFYSYLFYHTLVHCGNSFKITKKLQK